MESDHDLISLFEHDLSGKSVSAHRVRSLRRAFPNPALIGKCGEKSVRLRHPAGAGRRLPRSKSERRVNAPTPEVAEVAKTAACRSQAASVSPWRLAIGRPARHPPTPGRRQAPRPSLNWSRSAVARTGTAKG